MIPINLLFANNYSIMTALRSKKSRFKYVSPFRLRSRRSVNSYLSKNEICDKNEIEAAYVHPIPKQSSCGLS